MAQAFGEGVYPHPDLVALCKQFFGTDDLKSPKLKLAFVSKSWYIYALDSQTHLNYVLLYLIIALITILHFIDVSI